MSDKDYKLSLLEEEELGEEEGQTPADPLAEVGGGEEEEEEEEEEAQGV